MFKNLKLVLFFIYVLFAFGMTADALDVYVDGQMVEFSDDLGYPYIEKGRTMLPLRAVTEACGAEVWWDDDFQTACVRKNEVTVYCTVGDKNIYRNGTRVENDVAAVNKNGRVYLPVRAVLEALDAKVDWDGNVNVTCESSEAFIRNIENSSYITEDVWGEWNNVLRLKDNGSYFEAIDAMKKLAPSFLAAHDYITRAIFYNKLGQCYIEVGLYDEGAACFEREAENWEFSGKEQEKIAAERKSKTVRPTVQMYAKTNRENYKMRRNFGELYEPENGLYNGVYAECDEKVNDSSSMKKFYMNEFPKMVGREMSSYLLYMNDGVNFSHYNSHFAVAKEKDKIMQIALEPTDIENIEKNDERYINFAKEITKSGVRVFIRFACEMNDASIRWSVSPETYKTKFRYVADIFHNYAPAAVMVWSPNFYPEDNYEDYYPGDKYVDYVGISSYMIQHTETDPLERNVDRTRWSNQLDTIYSLYGYKKPIIVSECGVTHKNYLTGKNIADFATKQLYDFYTYLPIRYPNVKAVYYFDSDNDSLKFKLSDNQDFLSAYKKSINNELYLQDPDNDDNLHQYYELGNNVNIYPENTQICSYFITPFDDISYVAYRINSKDVGVSYSIPYSVNVDFSLYSGQAVEIKAIAFDYSGKIISEKAYYVKVWDFSYRTPDNIYVEETEDINVVVNGKNIKLEQTPKAYGNSVMVPFREVATAIGYSVNYDVKSHSMVAVKGDRKVSVLAGKNKLILNNISISIDAAPIEISENFLVSVDALDKGLRCNYDWDVERMCVKVDERNTYWSDWVEELPSDINNNLYYIENKKEYRYREREKEYFSSNVKIPSGNYVKTIIHEGDWSSWQSDYIASSSNVEVRTRTVSSGPKRYYYGHYCTGNIGDPENNYCTWDRQWCDEARFHELGWYDYKLPASEPGSSDSILYDGNGKKIRCPNSCYRWYVMRTEGGEYTEYSYRELQAEHIYFQWSSWSRWSSWSKYEPDYDDYDDEIDIDVEKRKLYRYKEK